MDTFAIAIFVNNKKTIIRKIFIFIKYLKLYNSFYSNTNSQPAPQASPAFFNASSTEPPANKVS